MAVGQATAPRSARATDFVRLKLRLVGNGMRGQGWRIAMFVIGLCFGVGGAVTGFGLFAASAADGSHHVGLLVAAFVATGVTFGWLLMPLLFFGVDETVDPARFALLPIPRRTLLRGMLAAAFVGIPAVATGVALLGLVLGGALRGGLPAAGVALAGGAIALLFCVAGSRALTSAFASMLRSRRVRDLAAILLALLASSIAPLQLAITGLLRSGDVDQAVRFARVLAWTPLAAPYVAHIDAAEGHWGTALARLAIGLGSAALMLLWWSKTIESAMIGTVSGGRSALGGATTNVVDTLFPKALRSFPRNRFTALVAREWRYWWRDPRRRASLISLTIAGVVLPVALRAGDTTGGPRTPLPLAVAFSAILASMVLSNQFGTDGTAYALHLLVGVPGRIELRARAVALTLLMAPILTTAVVVVGILTGARAELPAAAGTVAAGLGVSAGASALVSVLAPYSFPNSTNPFAVSGNTAGLRGLLALVGSLAALVLVAPVLVLAMLVDAGVVVLAAGVAWGAGGLLLGTHLAGDILDRRGPEILVAITPRR
jgi:ABC-2 type transport system permease protein